MSITKISPTPFSDAGRKYAELVKADREDRGWTFDARDLAHAFDAGAAHQYRSHASLTARIAELEGALARMVIEADAAGSLFDFDSCSGSEQVGLRMLNDAANATRHLVGADTYIATRSALDAEPDRALLAKKEG